MSVGESKGPRDASRPRDEQDPPYEGRVGRTRARAVHVPRADGLSQPVQVYEVVNVATHPELREPALNGSLHRLDGAEPLALPFVYHDPQARKLALVVPESRRHEELALRAETMVELARDTEHLVPAYARELTSVVGGGALAAYLERASSTAALGVLEERERQLRALEEALGARAAAEARRETSLEQRARELEQRARELEAQREALGQREARLHQRAEGVTRREDELRTLGEELEAARASLGLREQELERRSAELRELAEQAASSLTPRGTEVVRLVDDEVEELEELEPLATSPGELRAERAERTSILPPVREAPRTIPPAGVDAPTRLHLGGHADAAEPERIDDLVEEAFEEVEPDELLAAAALSEDGLDPEVREVDELGAVDEDEAEEVEELDEVESIGDVTGLYAGVLPESQPHTERPAPLMAPRASEPPPPPPSVVPPPGFLGRQGPPVQVAADAGGVQVFVRLPEGKDELLDQTADLLTQLVVIEEQPVVLLTLVADPRGRPHGLRAALDPRGADERAVLDSLRRRFAARVSTFSAGGRYLRSFELEAPREVNVARVMERVARMKTAAPVDSATAIERVLSAPPPLRAKDHPFLEEEAPPGSADEAARRLDRMAEWSSHEKLDYALLLLSIPHDVVERALRRTLEHAVEHGLSLSPSLSERAVALGVAPDLAALVARQIEAMTRTCRSAERGGLSAQRVTEEWERLLEAATRSEVAIDTETHALAWKAIREVRGGGEGPTIDPSKLVEMGPPELVMLLEHPNHRRDAALELCRRGDPALGETLCKSVRKMPRPEVVRVVPRLTELGEELGDALIDGLGARKTFVRQAFALALGHLKLRRAVVPLVHLLASEDSEVWREVARVVGSFGTASLRNVARQAREPKGREERYVWTLAHLANHGCAKQVEKLASEDVPAVAAMAAQALTLRERARLADNQVRGTAPMSGNDPVPQFSRRFYQELEGAAPADDLPDDAGTES